MGDVELAGEGISRMEPRDRRRAHLTVARVSARQQRDSAEQRGRGRRPARPAVDLSGITHALSVYRGPVWLAEEVELVQSRLGAGRGGRPLHAVVAVAPLSGRPADLREP